MFHIKLKPEAPESKKTIFYRSNKALLLSMFSICIPFVSPIIGFLCIYPTQWIFQPQTHWVESLVVSVLGFLIGTAATLLAGVLLATWALLLARRQPEDKAPWITATLGLAINSGLLLAGMIWLYSSLAR